MPFFARDATLGDTVAARQEDGNLWFERLVHCSGDAVEAISDGLSALGCVVEYVKAFNLLAASVPPSVSLEGVQGYLQVQARSGTV